jgi:hypothetical protein
MCLLSSFTASPGAPRLLLCLAVARGGLREIVDWKHIAGWYLRAFHDPPPAAVVRPACDGTVLFLPPFFLLYLFIYLSLFFCELGF